MDKRPVLLMIMLILFTVGCVDNKTPLQQIRGETEEKSLEEAKNYNIFDPRKIHIGDTIAGMNVEAISLENNGEDYPFPVIIQFSGEVTVSGQYVHHNNDEFLGDSISFRVDEETKNRLPKLEYDERYTWFVFSNGGRIKEEFGEPGDEGKATVIIDDYLIRYAPTETYNEGRVVKIITKEE